MLNETFSLIFKHCEEAFQSESEKFSKEIMDSNWFSRRSKVRFIEFKRSKLETKKDRKSSKIIEKCSGNMEKWCDEWKKVIEGSNYLLDIWLWLPSFAGTKFCNWCPPAYLHISSQMSSHIISVISTRAYSQTFILTLAIKNLLIIHSKAFYFRTTIASCCLASEAPLLGKSQ